MFRPQACARTAQSDKHSTPVSDDEIGFIANLFVECQDQGLAHSRLLKNSFFSATCYAAQDVLPFSMALSR